MADIWIDTNVLIAIAEGEVVWGEAVLVSLRGAGHNILVPHQVEIEFLSPSGRQLTPGQVAARRNLLTTIGAQIDRSAAQLPVRVVRALRDQAMNLGTGALRAADANVVAHVRASAAVRRNAFPILITHDLHAHVGIRAMQVEPIVFTQQVPTAVQGALATRPPALPAIPPIPPRPRAAPTPPRQTPRTGPRPVVTRVPNVPPVPITRMGAIRAGLGEGIRGAFSAPSLISMIPDIVLIIANKFAARDELRRISIDFLKSGFARGVAARLVGWSLADVNMNLMNLVTAGRIKNYGEIADLGQTDTWRLAESCENYGVAVGWFFADKQTMAWEKEIRSIGFAWLVKTGYDSSRWGADPDAAFHQVDFIDKFAWAIHWSTDQIVGPTIKFN